MMLVGDSMEIRIARCEDAKYIQKIYEPYVKKTAITFEYEVPTVAEMQNRIEKTLKKYPYLEAIIDHQIVGYAYASAYSSRKAYDWSCELSIYIDENYHHQGIASALYKNLFEILKVMNIQTVYACITYPNVKSEAFHKKFGFERNAFFKKSGYKFKQWQDMIWMEKSIGNYGNVDDLIPFPTLNNNELNRILNNDVQ